MYRELRIGLNYSRNLHWSKSLPWLCVSLKTSSSYLSLVGCEGLLMKNKYIPFFLLLLGLVCTACSSEKKGLAELKSLCEKDAGLRIYKTVQAEGYYDTTGGFDLVLSPYKFYEFCDNSPSPSKFNVIPEPGCYRVEKVKRKEGQCHPGYDEALEKVVVDPYPEFLTNHCISVQKIDKPMARYSYYADIEVWKDKNEKSGFIRSEISIKDSSNDNVLGGFINYSYTANPVIPVSKSCDDIDAHYSSFADIDLVNKVLIPIQ